MNISLTKELEKLIEAKVKSGLYQFLLNTCSARANQGADCRHISRTAARATIDPLFQESDVYITHQAVRIEVHEVLCYRSMLADESQARTAAAGGTVLVVASPSVADLLARAEILRNGVSLATRLARTCCPSEEIASSCSK